MGGLQTIQDAVLQRQPDPTNWYALHTRSRHEKRVAAELEQKGITAFLPLISTVRKWSDRHMRVELPLFSCYVFVNIPGTLEIRVAALRTPGVLAFVGGHQLAASIPNQEIAQIQTLLDKKVPCTSHPFWEVGQRVRVRGGALDGIEGILSRFNGNNRLVISVQTIQRSLSITVDGYDVEPVGPIKRTLYV